MRTIILVVLFAVLAFAAAQQTQQTEKQLLATIVKKVQTAIEKKSKQTAKPKSKKPLRNELFKLLQRKFGSKKVLKQKSKVVKILRRLVKQGARQAKLAKLPLKKQVKIARNKLNKRVRKLRAILANITVVNKKDDGEKKVLKKILRSYATKDLFKIGVQRRLLNKVAKQFKKKATKKPTTKAPKTKKPTKKPTKKATKKTIVKKMAKLLEKKVSPKKAESEKKKVKKILKKLVKKVKALKKLAKSPLKMQIKLARVKIARKLTALGTILRTITPQKKKDDDEKIVLKTLLRNFAAKDLLRVHIQKRMLNRAVKANKAKTTQAPKKN